MNRPCEIEVAADGCHRLPPFEKLSPYWVAYFKSVDESIAENFWGNLDIFLNAQFAQDSYISQMMAMGYVFEPGHEKPAPFYDSIKWIFEQIQTQIDAGLLAAKDALWPGKIFERSNRNGDKIKFFVPIGAEVPKGAVPLNLLIPEDFVRMLASGYFPIGNAVREHTNQSLAEHDLAHRRQDSSVPSFYQSGAKSLSTRPGENEKESKDSARS